MHFLHLDDACRGCGHVTGLRSQGVGKSICETSSLARGDSPLLPCARMTMDYYKVEGTWIPKSQLPTNLPNDSLEIKWPRHVAFLG